MPRRTGPCGHGSIEHTRQLEVIKTADWIIDLGPGVEDGTKSQRGDKGGEIVAEGTPEQVAEEPRSYTGHYLKPLLQGTLAKASPAKKKRGSASMRQREAAE